MLMSVLLLQLVSKLVSIARQHRVLGRFDTNFGLGFRVPPGGLEPPTVGLKARLRPSLGMSQRVILNSNCGHMFA